jgi:hypothetical protein
MAGKRHQRLTYKLNLPGGQSRLREMILYVADRCKEAPRFGKVKLNKILWRADFSAFAERGQPVTGRPYQRLKNGPAPVEMPPVLAEMLQDELAAIKEVSLSDSLIEERVVPLRPARLHFFSPDDIRFVDEAINYYWDHSAREASDDSHGIAWRTRDDLEPMPYELAYLSDEELPPRTFERLIRRAEERGLKSE